MKLSKKYSLNRSQAELDFVDVDINRDLPLFVDPHFLGRRTDPWSMRASQTIRSFFGYFLGLLSQGEIDEARSLFDHLHEPNETCLGLSRKRPRGNGIGDEDAQNIFDSLAQSEAVKTGVLADLEDCRLFVKGIDKDKTSDMTTNIIRGHLVAYTQQQCALWGIPLTTESQTGFCWNAGTRSWENGYSDNLYVGDRRILMVPKAIVSYSKNHTPRQLHQHFILNFLQHEHLRMRSALVQTSHRKDGSIREFVTKKDLVEKGGASFGKDFLASFTKAHPQVFAGFKNSPRTLSHSLPLETFLDQEVQEIASYLRDRLIGIPVGAAHATEYHRTAAGILDFLFYPNLISPIVEKEIHDGRKRLDLTFDNAAADGFFFRLHQVSRVPCPFILIECKNYGRDIANPELDQMAGRFGPNRGEFGLVVCRSVQNLDLFLDRCRDTFRDNRGLILPLTDTDLLEALRNRPQSASMPLEDRLSDLYRIVALA